MKRTIFLLLLSLFFSSCEKQLGHKFYREQYLTWYITMYVDIPLSGVILRDRVTDEQEVSLRFFGEGGNFYLSPDFGGTGKSAEKFREISERNGDHYNRVAWVSPETGRECPADNFKSMDVVCLDRDWDAAHPAGASLKDVTKLSYITYAPYIRADYTGEEMSVFTKPLADLAEDDLTMIHRDYLYLSFDIAPPEEAYTLRITMTTTDGRKKVAEVTYTPQES